jgi:excisionase family DNA binding protein
MEDEYFTVAEIATRFKVNPQTVRNWIDAGQLPAIRVGARRVRVRRTEVEDFISREPQPQRRRFPSQAERLTQLEAQVSELTVAVQEIRSLLQLRGDPDPE